MTKNKFWILCLFIVSSAVVSIAAIILFYCYSVNTEMAKLGYQQTPIADYHRPVWQKVDNNCQ